MSNMASDAKVSFSSKVEYHAVIRYLYLKGKTGQQIHCELTYVYGFSAPSYAQVKFQSSSPAVNIFTSAKYHSVGPMFTEKLT